MLKRHAKAGVRRGLDPKAYIIEKSGKKKRIKAKGIRIELAGGGQIFIPLTDVPNNRILGLVTGSLVSREKGDHSHFVILPACSNVLYLDVEREKGK